MSFARFSPLRTAVRRISALPRQTGSKNQWQRIARRGYADAHGAAKQVGSDLPWLIGSIAVTVPGTYFILNSGGSKGDDHHHHKGAVPGEGEGEEHEESHDEEHEESHDEETTETVSAGDDEKSGDSADSGTEAVEDSSDDTKESSDDKDQAPESKNNSSDDSADVKSGENKIEGKPASSDNEGKDVPSQPSDNKISMPTKDGDDSFDKEHEIETDSDNKTIHKPDAKGGAKRRVESSNAIELNKAPQGDDEKDKASASKNQVKDGSMSGKQAGISNTNTKHSTDPAAEGKSTKSEGAPETAKLQGTVQPDRPLK